VHSCSGLVDLGPLEFKSDVELFGTQNMVDLGPLKFKSMWDLLSGRGNELICSFFQVPLALKVSLPSSIDLCT
jgi:hypothetical protein